MKFPKKIDPNLKDLIQKLLVIDPKKRLGSMEDPENGINAIKNHPFFQNKFYEILNQNKFFLEHLDKERRTNIEPDDDLHPTIIKQGEVRKYKYYFFYDT